MLQGAIVAMGIGALARPTWARAARARRAARHRRAVRHFGQTYQTGADPRQLFALWAALALPLALGVRSDLLWAPWTLIAFVAIALWIHAHTGHRWRVEPDDLAVHLLGWAAAGAIVLAMSALARRLTAPAWALRTAVTLAVVVITSTALAGLFSRSVATHYGLAARAGRARRRLRAATQLHVFALSAVALGLNTLAVAGLGRLLFENAQWRPDRSPVPARRAGCRHAGRQRERRAPTGAPTPPPKEHGMSSIHLDGILERARAQAFLPADARAPAGRGPPWPVVLLTALGAGWRRCRCWAWSACCWAI